MPDISTRFTEQKKKLFDLYFQNLNEKQREAVYQINGPLLILAGAGSGKTTVLVNRLAYLTRYGNAYHDPVVPQNAGVLLPEMEKAETMSREELGEYLTKFAVNPPPAWSVMAITFTNKAAREIKERIKKIFGEDSREAAELMTGTFHSICLQFLRRYGSQIGYDRNFTICDMDDVKKQITQCMKQLNIDDKTLPVKTVMNAISRAKDKLIAPPEFSMQAGVDVKKKQIAAIYELYSARMHAQNLLDFDDIIMETVRLLTQCADVREMLQNRYRYISVDEYQDTNYAQLTLTLLLSGKYRNIMVVGDDDQSIYKFRGATIENILSFENTFQNATVIRLEQNYRSTQNILDAANAVIEHNTERKGKTLWTQNGTGAMIHLHTAENETDEAERITKIILDGVAAGRKFSDYAVLYRMNSQSLTFERNFAKSGVPHRIIGGTRFYERREIREMIAYLSVINNPSDEMRLRRIINTPKRSIGDRSVEVAAQIGQQTGETLFEVVSHAKDYPALSRAANKMTLFAAQMQGLIELNNDEEVTLGELYDELVERIDYLNFLKTDDPESAEDRAANVQELASNLRRFEEENPEGTLSDFLEEVSLITDIDNYDNNADSVVLMTVHSAKGLEFPVVFLPGMEENIFPGMASVYVPSEVEEERRLAYVAITRAKEELYIFHAESRMIFGMTNRNRVSRFVEEIPETLVEHTRSRDYSARPVSMPSFGGAKPFGEAPKTKSVAEAGGFTPKPRVKPAPAGTYRVGDTVLHKAFGTGLIVSATPMANDTLLEVAFDKVGTKKLFANFARLTKV